MNVETWLCFWVAVIGIAEVIQAHKPPVIIVEKEVKGATDDTESDNIT